MGLDMYLYGREFVSGYDASGEEEGERFSKVIDLAGFDRDLVDGGSPHAEVSVCIGYWRKANAIHAWFVDQCGGGRDECQEVYVSLDSLTELRNLCADLLATEDAERAVEELSPRPGFFFGSTDIDEWYWEDLRHTVKVLDKAINLRASGKTCSFYYQASW